MSVTANPVVLGGAAQAPTWVAGGPGRGQALRFDGVDDFAQAVHSPAYALDTFTLDFWVRTTDTAGTLVRRGTSPTENFNVFIDGAPTPKQLRARAGSNAGALQAVSSRTAVGVNDGLWHHVAVVVDAGLLTLYVDGVAANQAPIGNVDNPVAPIRIGEGAEGAFAGDIDEFRLQSVARTPAEVQRYVTARVPDYGTGTWAAQPVFGACLRSTTNATGVWTAAPGSTCNAADGTHWRGIAALQGDAGARVATATTGETNASASIRFGFAPGAGLPAGSYAAPLVFEAIAPAV